MPLDDADLAAVPLPPPAGLRAAAAAHAHRLDDLSAAMPAARWQKAAGLALLVLLVCGLAAAPRATQDVLLCLSTLPFLAIALLRIVALRDIRAASGAAPAPPQPRRADETLPRYSLLIPLYREERVVAQLVTVMAQLDYPAHLLDILLITEADDEATARALAAVRLPAHFSVVRVPPGAPRTKPRALNHALAQARGEFIVVYDAEDVPERDQLRRAVAALTAGESATGGRLGCVQARLNVYNRDDGFLARQFTIEYTALFDAILPALARLDLPVPLGGTSNHFPRAVLEATGGWDPYNVTEDADLGLRLARLGFSVGILDSTTWEEAPGRWAVWRRQRTRWLKGWMQTWLVHMRAPRRLARDVGARRFIALQAMFAAMVLSALLHPLFYAMLAIELMRGTLLEPPQDTLAAVLWWTGAANLAAGYATALALGVAAVGRRGWRELWPHAVLLPVYWLAISEAAYRALWHLATAPFVWEKTEHTGCAPAALVADAAATRIAQAGARAEAEPVL